MNFLENITIRRNRVQIHLDPILPHEDSDVISQTSEGSTNSLPELSGKEDFDQIRILKEEFKFSNHNYVVLIEK